jgi:hypothetical protein
MGEEEYGVEDLPVLRLVLEHLPYGPLLAYLGVVGRARLSFPVSTPEGLRPALDDGEILTFRHHSYRYDDIIRFMPAELFPIQDLDGLLWAAQIALQVAERQRILDDSSERTARASRESEHLDVAAVISIGAPYGEISGHIWRPQSIASD